MRSSLSEADEAALHYAGLARHLMYVSVATLVLAAPLLILIGTFVGPFLWFISLPLGGVVVLTPTVLAVAAAAVARRASRAHLLLSTSTQVYVARTRLMTEGYFGLLLLGGFALLAFG